MATVRFVQVAGDPALELLNTVDWRLSEERRGELLGDAPRVLDWAAQTGFLDSAERVRLGEVVDRDTDAALALVNDAQRLRENAYAMLVGHDDAAAERVVERYRQSLVDARLAAATDGEALRWLEASTTPRTPVDRAVRGVVDLARSDRVRLLQQCADDVCGWVYLDTSPRHNRRWCSASDCGDRNRARAYYRRRRAAE
ncbi:CGNR zinc finger domain-containing protein [Phycicoccus sp. CSK15P-2]|uniref:CGNR zinc finger domain-containing protein n=1 Tax=Phycicoccus sp. CSK15P-2 TaxID=2807627 RepID=UPI00194EA6CC|nr:CGNR zinc finger domain-containing protein [Phycicoccus sp. CSK15P-2]MBM6404451.1 CGNR zinc finger domain-containing protein [Phycicoccus sp. CSK15P-2]